MKKYRKGWYILVLIMTLSLAFQSMAFGSEADTKEGPEITGILEKIITLYGNYEEQADPAVTDLLSQLTELDPVKGELWTNIMEYWDFANTELEVYTGQLPEGLPEDDSMCIVVLGFELNPDGTMQDELIGRLETALACAAQYPNAYIVCTGGGTAKDNPDVTEAGLMSEWLLSHGLQEDRLIIEDASHTTAENAEFTYEILLDAYPQVDSVAIVTSSYHVPWGALLFEAAFMQAAAEKQMPPLHVISNCAYPTTNEKYKESEITRWETGGMLQFIGDTDLAMQYYQNAYPKPALE